MLMMHTGPPHNGIRAPCGAMSARSAIILVSCVIDMQGCCCCCWLQGFPTECSEQ